eukprot:c1304_g1_i1.p1 GENE.c1304_g1_i1~~c1304_g1_i1.p1  ORF type:complete len:360 (-),score=127.76 c1304_g1_i1:328-1350(-)
MSVPQRKLGSQGLVASAQGLGCMGMTAFYGAPVDDDEGVAVIGKALELGINLLDTAHIYQDFAGTKKKNEVLVGKALAKYGREKFVVATKFGLAYSLNADNTINRKPDSSKECIRKQLEESLQNLGTSYVDLYYQHRPDPNTPVEDVVTTLKELVEEGKVKYIGLSECTPSELRRAHAIHPITAIQMEWSLQSRDIEQAVVPTARELGVAIVAYSPLGRGLLSKRFTSTSELESTDFRKHIPRVAVGDNLAKNNEAVSRLEEIAKEKGVTVGQLALAWVQNQGDDVFPIPGTRNASRLAENAHAATLTLTSEDKKRIEEAVPEAAGERYPGMLGTFNQRV